MKQPLLVALACTWISLGLAATPSVSRADAMPAPTPVPAPHVDFSSMSFMMGTWNCTSMLRGKQRPETDVTTMSPDGTWMVTQGTAPPFDQYRNFAVNSTTYMTYDPSIKRWVTTGIDSTGLYFISSSPGWDGNTITWTSKGLDGTSVTDVVTKASDTHTTDNLTITPPSGKTTTVSNSCTKSGS
jgi:hypothetical protein